MLAVELNFSAEFRQNIIYSGHTPVQFLLVEYEEDYRPVQRIDEPKFSGNGTINVTSYLMPLENFIARTTVSNGLENKVKVVGKGIQSILNELCRCHDDAFEVSNSSSSRWVLVPFSVSYFYDIQEGKYLSGMHMELWEIGFVSGILLLVNSLAVRTVEIF